jgi:hypothetical protein
MSVRVPVRLAPLGLLLCLCLCLYLYLGDLGPEFVGTEQAKNQKPILAHKGPGLRAEARALTGAGAGAVPNYWGRSWGYSHTPHTPDPHTDIHTNTPRCADLAAVAQGQPRIAVAFFGASRDAKYVVPSLQRHLFDVLDR